MVTGWRRAFCTSITKEDRETPSFLQKQQQQQQQQQHSNSSSKKKSNNNDSGSNSSSSPRISSKFGFFSNPSTPCLKSQPVPSPSLRSWINGVSTTTAASSESNSTELQCNPPGPRRANNSRLFHFSNPTSPTTPSSFSFLKTTLGLSKSNLSRCGICLECVKSGQETAIFTAECNHVFHFPCLAAHVKMQQLLICPACGVAWRELPLLAAPQVPETNEGENKNTAMDFNDNKAKKLRVYNDDEPLMSLSPGSLFNPILELEENDVGDEPDANSSEEFQFHGFFVDPALAQAKVTKDFYVSLLPESAVLTVRRNDETRVVVLKVKAPPSPAAGHRAPIDLVALLDCSERMGGLKSQVMKQAMRLMISSLGSNDRMSIVAFSASSKRLLPLRRMTPAGRRTARRIVNALGNTGRGMSVSDALKKAAKVIEDRREKNPGATVIIFSDGQDDWSHTNSINQKRSSSLAVSSTRFPHLEIPVHSIGFGDSHAPPDDALVKCFRGLLSVAVHDLKLQLWLAPGSAAAEIPAIYPLTGLPSISGPGSVRVGDLLAEEERQLLVELRVPAPSVGPHHVFVRSSFWDPWSHEPVVSKELALLLPLPQAVRSSLPGIQRLRNLHLSTRAVAESRQLMELNDLSGAYHLLSSARALFMQSGDGSAGEYVRGLEAELAELHRRRRHIVRSRRQSGQQAEEKPEPLTSSSSAWRAAERLAKVAIMRKHVNRVSDLHGFENARF